MNHIVLTRINFEDDELFKKYFEVMKNTYIPSIKSQRNKNFKIGFIIKDKHIQFLKPFFGDEVLYFRSTSECSEYCSKNNFQIQTRHDCDDWMRVDYIDKIQKTFLENINKKDVFLIHSKVQKLNYHNGDLYRRGDIDYTNNKSISMFLTLCQKNVNHFVYEKDHGKMKELTNDIFLLDEGHTRLVIHGNNILSKIHPKDVFLKNIYEYDLSIIIPTYDNVEYLPESLKSMIESGKGKKIEILVGVDSCEKTKNYIYQNIKQFQEFIRFYFFEKNVGPYVIRNSLAKIANSNNILFFDSDDIAKEELIPLVLKNLTSHDVVRYKFYNFKNPSDIPNLSSKNVGGFFSVGQLGIKKDLFMGLNGFEPWVCAADAEFLSREIGNNLKTIKLNVPLFYRRRHDKNITILPETNAVSNIRQNYHRIIEDRKRKKMFGKLIELPTTKFYKIENDLTTRLVNDYDNLDLFQNVIKTTKPKIQLNDNFDLSIIIPTYNNIEFIDESLDSIINSAKNYDVEILVGIDGCEKSLNHIKQKIYPNFIKFYFFNGNNGPYDIKNTLVTLSKSDKIIFFDSDDIMTESAITEIVNNLNNHDLVRLKYKEIINKKITDKTNFHEGAIGIKKDLFISMNGFEPWMCAADSDFLIRLYKKRPRVYNTKNLCMFYRRHSSSLTLKKETGMSSILRSNYAKIIKNKKGYGDPDKLYVRDFDVINGSYEYIEQNIDHNSVDNTEIINRVFNKLPKVIEINQINKKEKQIIVSNNPLINILNKKETNINKHKVTEQRQNIEQIKQKTNREVYEKLHPSKPNRRLNLPNIGLM